MRRKYAPEMENNMKRSEFLSNIQIALEEDHRPWRDQPQNFVTRLWETKSPTELFALIEFLDPVDIAFFEFAITQQRNHLIDVAISKMEKAMSEPTTVVTVAQKEVVISNKEYRMGKGSSHLVAFGDKARDVFKSRGYVELTNAKEQ